LADANVRYKISQTGAEKVSSSFKQIAGSMAAAFGGFAILGGIKKMGTAFIDLDKGMRLVNTITKVTAQELKTLTSQVVDLSSELGTPTSQMTGAIYQAVSAGIEYNKILGFMKVATKGAIAGNAAVQTSVDALTTILNSFKAEALTVIEVSDLMFKTIELGKTDMDKLAASYFNVASTAAVSGIKFAELSAAISLLTLQGTKTSVAMTQLRQLILAVNKTLGDGWRKTMTFQEALQELIRRTEGSQNELLKLVTSTEALQAALGLTGVNTKKFTEFLNKMGEAAGSTKVAFNEMEQSVGRDFDKFGVDAENLGIRIAGTFFDLLRPFTNIVPDTLRIFQLAAQDFVNEWNKVAGAIDNVLHLIGLLPASFSKGEGSLGRDIQDNLKRGGLIAVETFKEVNNEVGEIKKNITKLKKDIEDWTGSIVIYNQMQSKLVTLEEQLKIPVNEVNELLKERIAIMKQTSAQGLAVVLPNISGTFPGGRGGGGKQGKPDASSIFGNRAQVGKMVKDADKVGATIFDGWANVLTSNMNTAWAEIFGEANSLFEQLVNSMVDLLVKNVFTGLLNFASAGFAGPIGGIIGGISSLFGSPVSSGGNQPLIVQVNLGGRILGQAVLEGNKQARQLRLTE